MRTIKFRGKRLDNDEWVYGFLYQLELLPYGGLGTMILTDDDNCESDAIGQFNLAFRKGVDLFMVDTDTVGQFTGLTDGNGKAIYEGDIIKEDNLIHQILWIDDASCFCRCNLQDADIRIRISRDEMRYVEVIGNIHDNPELIEKGGQS